ncbi:MAG: tRNA pseudouridine(55) synthase TruB [Bacteroidetes bacterium]|nr:tRNA pseudouridine(55) synthase TruB [Bacteroidota bacterium]
MNFLEGTVMLVDKPYGWTSFDVVNKLRWHLKRALKVKKIKVGHAGTLDPLATGLLIICTGKQTKKVNVFMAQDKTYTGTFLLGKTTPSFDLETQYNATFPTDHITESALHEVSQSFLGEQHQIAPLYSAKQVNGKRAYLLAREGKHMELKSHAITIMKFITKANQFPEIDFEISCSKGTYIRAIAQEFGARLGSGATLIALKRTQSGEFRVEEGKSVEDWIHIIKSMESPTL